MSIATRAWPAEELAAGYDLLATAFLYGPLQLDSGVREAWQHRLAGHADLLTTWQEVEAALVGLAAQKRALDDFQRCLEIPLPGQFVPPYASLYLDSPPQLWGVSTQRVLVWYRAGGVEWRPFRQVAAPDHVGVEWAFLAELSAHPSPAARLLRQTFISEHLAKWLPAFAARLNQAAASPYYPALTRWAMLWSRATEDNREPPGEGPVTPPTD
ncbi:MAG: molecular chaperone TorD family protein [Thermaerobacter sp.]|nr:molecular chaperone TorD family protein [Thermaerobacter sp.]